MPETRDALLRPGAPHVSRLEGGPPSSLPGSSRGTQEEAQPIPTDRSEGWEARAVVVDRHGVAAACYQRLAWKLRRELEARSASTVAITSAVRHEGKTVTACNLALALASLARGRVALVDLDLRGPSVGRALGLRPRIGFESCLGRGASVRDVRIATDRSLDVFPAVAAHPDAHEALGAPALAEVLDELRRTYDIVVVDSPPVLAVPDTPLIMQDVESCICVVRAGRTQPAALQETLELLPREKLLGLFLNEVRSVERSDRYQYYENQDRGDDAKQ